MEGVPAVSATAGLEAEPEVLGSVWGGRRQSNQPPIIMFTPSRTAIATAHSGNRAFGGAIFTSKSAGPLCLWRSVSDFFSASRMNDIAQPPWALAR